MKQEKLPTRRNTVKHWVLTSLDAFEADSHDAETGYNPARQNGVTPGELLSFAGGDESIVFRGRQEVSNTLSALARDGKDATVQRRTEATGFEDYDVRYRYRLTQAGREAIEALGVPSKLPNRHDLSDDERELDAQPGHEPGWWRDVDERTETPEPDEQTEPSDEHVEATLRLPEETVREMVTDVVEAHLTSDEETADDDVTHDTTAPVSPSRGHRSGGRGPDKDYPTAKAIKGEDLDWRLCDCDTDPELPGGEVGRGVLDAVAAADGPISSNEIIDATEFNRKSVGAYLSVFWQNGLAVRAEITDDDGQPYYVYRLSGDAMMLYRNENGN